MAKKISLINMKGGVGKSTIATNLGHHFAGFTTWVKKVLVVDIDPQFNATQYLLGYEKAREHFSKGKPSTYHIFEKNTPEHRGINLANSITNVISYKGGSRLDIIPAQQELAYTIKNPGDKAKNLAEFITTIEHSYDVIIFDCSPTDSILTEAAYLASNYIIVPVLPQNLSAIGIPLLYQSVLDFKQKYPNNIIEIAGIVFNATEGYSPEEYKAKDEVKKVAVKYGIPIFCQEISFSRSYPKSSRENQPIHRTTYARPEKKQEFYNFTCEVAQKVGI